MITSMTALYFCFTLPKMSVETIIYLPWLTSVVILTYRRCSAVQPFYSNIKVIAYAVLTVRIYKRINQSNASAKVEKLQNLISQHTDNWVCDHIMFVMIRRC